MTKPSIAQIEPRELASIPMGEAREVRGVLVIVRPEGYDIGGDLFNRDCDAAAEIRQYN